MDEFLSFNDLPHPSEWNEGDYHQALGSCLCNQDFREMASIIKDFIPYDFRMAFIDDQCDPAFYEDDKSFIEAIS